VGVPASAGGRDAEGAAGRADEPAPAGGPALVGAAGLAAGSAAASGFGSPIASAPEGTAPTSLRAAADRLDTRFAFALGNRDVDGCVAAILDLEQVILDWSADTLTSDEGDHARALLRAMVVRLGELAHTGARDPREVLDPLVSALLAVRQRARVARDWAASDEIRDRLAAAGVEVRDLPDGPTWQLI
jgi:cysteinyl-tRNA synthetase